LEDTPVQHVWRQTLEHYVPEEGRKVNLWSLPITSQEFFEDVQRASLKVAKAFLEAGLEEKRDVLVGAGRHERDAGREDYRNGYYLRKSFQTAIGLLEKLRVPRCRKRSLVRELERQLKRTKGAFEEKGVEMFLKGLSVRAIGPLLDGLLGLPVSSGQVSRLAHQWDHRVCEFHQRPLEDRYEYLFFDGLHLKRRSAPRLFRTMAQARHRVVLVCYGITTRGVKELIGYRLESSESEAGWRRFLGSLRRRGLAGRKVRLIVTDGGKGLLNALDDFYPESFRQRCWFHKMSNVLTRLRKSQRTACLRGLRKVYTAQGRAQAEQAYGAWAQEWRHKEPSAVRCVETDLESLLSFYSMPKTHWKMLRTTNAIERCFREVRRRTRSIGCFVNDDSLERMIYGLFRFLNERRAGKVCLEFKAAEAA
jgi:putative transposase